MADVACAAIIDLMEKDTAVRAAFVDLALAGRIATKILKKALKECDTYTAEEYRRLLRLLHDPDANLRFIAMPLLDSPQLAPTERLAMLALLGKDLEPQIRETAIRMVG